MNIHDAGIEHNDMEYPERNIVVTSDGDIRILDFERSKFHQCERKREPPIVDGFPESQYTYGCQEMWCLCDDLLWTPGEYFLTRLVSFRSH